MTLMPETRKVPPITLPTRLRLAREWRNLDQQQVADELGISRATVSNYETGKTEPGKMALNAWAVVADVDVEWLKTGDEQNDTDPNGPGVESRLGESNSRPSHYNVRTLPVRDLVAA